MIKLFMMFIIFLVCFSGKVFGVRKTGLDIWLHSYSRNIEGTGVHMKEIASELKKTYGYEYSDVRDKMTFDTTISIEKKKKRWFKDEYKYSIKIRKR